MTRRRRREQSVRRSDRNATYDAGALLAAEANDTEMQREHERLLSLGHRPFVLVVVLAQAWRGGPQPRLSRLLKDVQFVDFLEHDARAIGEVLKASGTGDIVDAAVVQHAVGKGNKVITSDPGDIRRIADALGEPLVVERPKRRSVSARRCRLSRPRRRTPSGSPDGPGTRPRPRRHMSADARPA